jgi:hypothetical protein
MSASEIRTELLEQHAHIRRMMDATRVAAVRASAGECDGDELRASLVALADAVRTHNLREELLLRDVIPSVDAWGPTRAAIMTESHIKEHDRLFTALLGFRSTPVDIAGAGIIALIALLRDHMDHEEAIFLREDVLRDDIVMSDQSAG